MGFWTGRRVLVTGGQGLLGSHVVDRLESCGAAHVAAPRSGQYDLVDGRAARRLLRHTKPDLVIHLAARVGGIGAANHRNPGTFFHDNLMMGVQLVEQARLHGVEKFVALGTVCSYPKLTPVPFLEMWIYARAGAGAAGAGEHADICGSQGWGKCQSRLYG